jgi:cytochrome c-type biogenesis protein CcmH/NrfG
MSASPSGDHAREDSAPIQPPVTANPLAPLARLVIPGLVAVVVICGVIYGVIPLWNAVGSANENYEKMRKDSVEGYSRPLKAPAGPFTPNTP